MVKRGMLSFQKVIYYGEISPWHFYKISSNIKLDAMRKNAPVPFHSVPCDYTHTELTDKELFSVLCNGL